MDTRRLKATSFIEKNRFIESNRKPGTSDERRVEDRRKSLHGDPAKSDTGDERRVGSRRLEDVLMTLEVRDENAVFLNTYVFQEVVQKTLRVGFEEMMADNSGENLMNVSFGENEVYIDTKMKYRDAVKRLLKLKGLSVEVIDIGVYTGEEKQPLKPIRERLQTIEHSGADVHTEQTAISEILGFSPDDVKQESESIIFRVFVKCLNEVHPVSGNFERDALKQDVSLEQRIIFMAQKHYPKAEKYNYITIIDQVFSQLIEDYGRIIHLEAEKLQLEERFEITGDNRLKMTIRKKSEEIDELRDSTIEDTIRTLYIYLPYFRDLVKIERNKDRIQKVHPRIDDRKVQILKLEEIVEQVNRIHDVEQKVMRSRKEGYKQSLGYLAWLKNEIGSETYFIRFLWVNNLRGRDYIIKAIESTMNAI